MSRSLIVGALLLLLICFVQILCDDFCFVLFFYCYLFEACSFLKRERKGVNPDGREVGRIWEG